MNPDKNISARNFLKKYFLMLPKNASTEGITLRVDRVVKAMEAWHKHKQREEMTYQKGYCKECKRIIDKSFEYCDECYQWKIVSR